MLARTRERLDALQRELPNAKGYPCDVTDESLLDSVIEAVRRDLGTPKVFIHNAVGGAFANFVEVDPRVLDRNFSGQHDAAAVFGAPAGARDDRSGEGAIVATGNTSALRGKPNFAGFARTRAAQRILAESIARELGPKGVHVAYVVIDAVIDLEWTRAMASKPAGDPFFIQPSAIADEIWHVVHQDRSAWSFNVEIRPFRETW
jgi:NAD(P)-dependent dehydrogenase (short-subunit alcohol dehydrogenase family)